MYQVITVEDPKFKVYELQDTKTNSWVKVAPERGGIILSYGVEGEELLYLNEETFYTNGANVRGGNPILFPISGQLTDKTYEWEGKTYTMNNHGFARDAVWEVVGSDTKDKAALTLKITSNEQTKESYPFDFEVVYTYVLEKGKLSILQEYKNTGNQPMPMYPGFHPYFKTKEKDLAYETDAAKYYDYNDGQEKPFAGRVDLTGLKESIVFLDATEPSISFQPSTMNKRIKLTYGKEFKYVVLWQEDGKEFICVEPWMAKTDELNRKDELVVVEGNSSLQTELRIEVVPVTN